MKQDARLFRTEAEIKNYFWGLAQPPVSPVCQKRFDQGVTIDTKLRREIMCGENRGNLVLHGTVHSFVFKNLGGGVWNVAVGPLKN
jgi:hypothetical protein